MQEIVQSVERALGILEIVSDYDKGIGLTEISNRIGLHKSTVHRLLSTLIYKGYIFQDQDSLRYLSTLKMYEIGYKRLSSIDLLKASKKHTKLLMESTNEVVHLVVRDGNNIVYIDKVDAGNTITMQSNIGKRNPLCCTSVGKAILSKLDLAEVKKIWDSSNIVKKTNNTITEFDEMISELEKVKSLGYAVDDEENELGIRCIGATIMNKDGKVEGAISISGPANRVTKEFDNVFGCKVKAIANQISKELGFIERP